jgi:outer membrane protein assembly factor BamE
MRPVARLTAAAGAALLLSIAGSGCVYRLDIQQGNLLDAEQVEQVEVGMTRSQVRFLLGTPMVIDTFDSGRWDYVYSLRRGHSRTVEKRHLIVWFDGDTVTRIEEPLPVPRKAPAESAAAG